MFFFAVFNSPAMQAGPSLLPLSPHPSDAFWAAQLPRNPGEIEKLRTWNWEIENLKLKNWELEIEKLRPLKLGEIENLEIEQLSN